MTRTAFATSSVRASARPSGALWLLPYLGVPYLEEGRSMNGADCLGWVMLVLEWERGVPRLDEAAMSSLAQAQDAAALRALVAARAAGWVRWPLSNAPEAWAVLEFAPRAEGLPAHVGLSLGGGAFVHSRRVQGVTTGFLSEREPGERDAWRERLTGVWWWEGRNA